MTAMLSCDGCGQIVSERPDDDDPTARWWSLSPSPAIGAAMLGVIALDAMAVDAVPCDLPPAEPDRHFCSIACVVAWAGRRRP